MGISLNCCHFERKSQNQINDEVLDLQDSDKSTKKKRVENINVNITQEKLTDFSCESPKVNNSNRDLFVQHLRKASGKIEENVEDNYIEIINSLNPTDCSKLILYMNSIPGGQDTRILNLNYYGLENSIRKANDGVTYFGSTNSQDDSNLLDVNLNFYKTSDERLM